MNPQSFNRFSYVLNRPTFYTDPSGHTYMCDEGCEENLGRRQYSLYDMAELFRVEFSSGWNVMHMAAALLGVYKVAKAFQRELGNGISEVDAFTTVYGLDEGETFYFEWDPDCWGCREDPKGCDAGTTRGDACVPGFGYTNTENWIEFASMSNVETPLRNVNNVIHELGHAFNLRLGRGPENALAVRLDLLVNGAGFYGATDNRTWEASSGINGSETFADQFLGWASGKWGEDPLGPVRAEFMNQMNGANGWVAQAAGLP